MVADTAELIARQVQAQPGAVAVQEHVAPYRTVTYAELWQLADRIAPYLVAARGRRGVLVGLDRSLELVASVLAAIRAGVPYILLDPTAPAGRHEFIAEQLGCDQVVTSASQQYWDLGAIRPVLLDESGDPPAVRPPSSAAASDVMYFASTSGSTGRPKLIEVPHRSAVAFLRDTRLCTVGPGKVMASISGPLSDATTMEIFKPLTAGGSVAVTPHPLELDISDWQPMIATARISHLFLFSPLLEMLGRRDPGALPGLDVLIFGGDAIDPAVVGTILDASAPGRLVHGYGPTEVTVFGTAYECTSAARLRELGTVPLGSPLDDYSVALVDDDGAAITGPGVGQIQFSGPGIAQGYLDGDGSRFLPAAAGGRWPRFDTGDRGERTADGELLFAGRMDRQVKVRGQRVELSGVERLLTDTFPGVPVVVELLLDGAAPGLACFYVDDQQDRALAAQMEASLRAVLPAASVPTRWIPLDAFPLTQIGKIDHRALHRHGEETS